MKIKIKIIIAAVALTCSCDFGNKIEFTQEPVVVINPELSAPLTCYIDFETIQEYDLVTFTLEDLVNSSKLCYKPADKKKLGYILMLMQPGREHLISIELTDKNGNAHKYDKKLKFKTPPLPASDAEFPKIQITKLSPNEMEEGLTLLNPRRRLSRSVQGENKFNQSFGMLVIVNHHGDVLWYYRTNSRISDFDLLPNGNLSYMTQDSKIVEIDFAGNIINQWYAKNRPDGKDTQAIPVNTLTFHHDVSMLPNGNKIALSMEEREVENYFTSEYDEKAPRKRQKVIGDVVVEFTPGGEIVHSWHAFDHMPVLRIGYNTFSGYWKRRGFPGTVDWSHANAIVPIPGENAYLVNFRLQSAMIKVDKTSNEIQWIFAEPSGWGKSLQDKLLKLGSDDWCWHQHSPRFTSKGNLLFFNNNNYQSRPFQEPKKMEESSSHVVEYRIDEEKMTVEIVWTSEIPNEQSVLSLAMGRVSELPQTGNILAGYGAIVSQEHLKEMTWENRADYPQWTMVREYKHTSPAQIVWEMRLLPRTEKSPVGWTLFGAERIELKQQNGNIK